MVKGKLKEEKQQKEKCVSDEDHCQKARVKDHSKDNKKQNSKIQGGHDEDNCLDERDSIKKQKKSIKNRDQTALEASGITTVTKELKCKGKDKSSDRKLHESTEEFARLYEDGNFEENCVLSSGKKKKEVKGEHSAVIQSLDEKGQSTNNHDKKAKKSKADVDEKRKKKKLDKNLENNQEMGDMEMFSDVDNVDKYSKKKRKRKAEPESAIDSGSSEKEDVEMLGSDHEVTEKTDVVKRKKKKKSKDQTEQESKPTEHPGLDYLHTWYTNRTYWNFKKVRQVWLLQNMFDQEQISDEDFCILLKYLEGLKGAAKDKTIEMAEHRIESGTGEQNAVVESRVRQVLQLLTE